MSHGPFGKRVERLPVAQGGTAASTPDEARKQLGAPSLTENNTFAGDQVIQGLLEADQLHANLSITTDGTVVIEEGTIDATLLTGSQSYQLPDQSGTLALTSDIVGGLADGDYGDVTVSGSGTAMSVDLAACPKIVATFSDTAAAGVGMVTPEVILASAPAGMYRMTVHIKVNGENGDTNFTPMGEYAGTPHVGLLVSDVGATSIAVANSNPVLSYCSIVGYHASGDIKFSTDGWTSTDSIDIYVVLERLL